jgi:DNA-directed RNA polymerase subunit RPC12/RpoP
MAIIRMMAQMFVYKCMKATCGYIEQYSQPKGAPKCPKCGSPMTKQ